MNVLHFIVFKQSSYINYQGDKRKVQANSLLIYREGIDIYFADGQQLANVHCSMKQLLAVTEQLTELGLPAGHGLSQSPFYLLALTADSRQALDFFLQHDQSNLMSFMVFHCLANDWYYFSTLFTELIAENGNLLNFLNEHVYNAWSVPRYAALVGLTVRKFNMLFKDSYGMSAKSWLREKRLIRAKQLLENTDMSVADIAFTSGFGNHAYFSESFRLRYHSTPRQWRERSAMQLK